MEWSDWITNKYIAWRGNSTGRDRSISEFSRTIGVPQPTISAWMKKGGRIPRDQKTISALVSFFGIEVYDVIGLPHPDTNDPRSVLLDSGFPPDFVEKLLLVRDEYTSELAQKGITQDTPEAREIVKKAFAKHGIQFTETK
jgi:hypothetical protein